MNKSIIILFAFFSAVFEAQSQGTSLGFKFGLNLSKETTTYMGVSGSTGSKAHFMGGAFLTTMFTENFGIQEEILYSGEGGQVNYGGTTTNYQFNYLNIPVLIRVKMTSVLNFHTGPQIGFLMSAKEDIGSGYQDIKSQYKSTQVGVAVGFGLDIPDGPVLGIRYIAGLSNTSNVGYGLTSTNNVFQFTFGLRFFKIK